MAKNVERRAHRWRYRPNRWRATAVAVLLFAALVGAIVWLKPWANTVEPLRTSAANSTLSGVASSSPAATATAAVADGPRLAGAMLLGSPSGRPTVVVLSFKPLAGGDLANEHESTSPIEPDDMEGAQPIVIPAGPDRNLLRLRGFADWLWSPGVVPQKVTVPDQLYGTFYLRSAPDGEWIAGTAWQDASTIVLWSPVTGREQSVSSSGIAEFHGVGGWTQDGSRIIVYRDPTSTFACTWDSWLALVDAQTGEVSELGPDLVPAVGAVQGLVQTSVASGVAAFIDEQGRVRLLEICADASEDHHLDLGGFVRAIDLEWSRDGRSLYVLATGDADTTAIAKFEYDASRRLDRVDEWGVDRDTTRIEAIDDSARWFVIRSGPETCPNHEIIDWGTGSTWALPCGSYIPVWLP